MTNEQETSADILVAMRNYSNECNDGYLTDYGVVCTDMRNYADRLEAALKRERGNAAKLRAALETALKTIRGVINSTISPRSNTVFDCRDKLSAALAAPPRNCDRFSTLYDAVVAWGREDQNWLDWPDEDAEDENDLLNILLGDQIHEFVDWLFATHTAVTEEQKGETK